MHMVTISKIWVSVVFVVSLSAQADGDFSYEKNTFINYYSCIGIYPGTTLDVDEAVWLFSLDRSPTYGKITHVIGTAEAEKRFEVLGFDKTYRDKRLWGEIGCAHPFRADMPASLARVSLEPKDSSDIGFAIRGLPSGAWISQGKGDSVSMGVESNPYVGLVQHVVTNTCYGPDSLVRVKQFPIRKGRTIIQLDIGKVKRVGPEKRKQKIEEEMRRVESGYAKWAWAKYKKETLDEWERKDFVESVEICRFFLDNERVLNEERISRSTVEDERIDNAPDLNTDNWADTTETAIGVISLNEGKDWDVLVVDVGWEGINYSIRRLSDSVVYYHRGLTTYH